MTTSVSTSFSFLPLLPPQFLIAFLLSLLRPNIENLSIEKAGLHFWEGYWDFLIQKMDSKFEGSLTTNIYLLQHSEQYSCVQISMLIYLNTPSSSLIC